jgi:hypothetical protein
MAAYAAAQGMQVGCFVAVNRRTKQVRVEDLLHWDLSHRPQLNAL